MFGQPKESYFTGSVKLSSHFWKRNNLPAFDSPFSSAATTDGKANLQTHDFKEELRGEGGNNKSRLRRGLERHLRFEMLKTTKAERFLPLPLFWNIGNISYFF